MAIGPSTTTIPYIIPVAPGVKLTSILTTGDAVNGYKMAGIPDGLGAYDNGDGTFTVLMNHEIANNLGAVRDHGGKGAFVSAWVIKKSDLSVVSGGDLIKNVYTWDTTSQKSNTTPNNKENANGISFSRFCSADLSEVSAYFNATTGLGTTARLFMSGEEGGATGYQLGIVATGANKGNAYILGEFNLSTNGSADSVNSTVKLDVLTASTSSTFVTVSAVPRELAVGAKLLGQTVTAINTTTKTITLSGNANATISTATPTDFTLAGVGGWENALANPFAQDKTIVIGNNDGGTGIMSQSVAVYVGTKTNTGSDADKAGLTNGTTKFINVTGNPTEIVNSTSRATNIPTSGATFTLSATSSTAFSRPEDGAWNPLNPKQYFFVTTDRIDTATEKTPLFGNTPANQIGRSRLWRLTFNDITNPDAGGTIDMLLDGTEGQNMFDNMTVDKFGHITLLEDTGDNPHNAKIWQYDIATDSLTQIAKTDPARFGDVVNGAIVPAATGFTVDEETSGVIDVQDILGVGKQLIVVQDHTASADTTLVEGGQLLVIDTSITANATASLVSGSSSDDSLTSSVTTGFDGVNDIIFTGAGNDVIDSTLNSASANVLAGGNRVDAGSGNDIINVANNDRSFGGDGNDEFFAQAVKGFRISGGAGDDKFDLGASTGGRALGGDGADTFFATSGGGNLLSGGAGADIFNIFGSDVLSAANIILDFQTGTDKIGFLSGITSIAGLTLTGSDIIIKSTNATIATLTGITTSTLTAGDFVFAPSNNG